MSSLATIPSHAASPIIHIHLRFPCTGDPHTLLVREYLVHNILQKALLGHDIKQRCLARSRGRAIWHLQGRRRRRRLRGQELVEAQMSALFAMMAALSHKDCERAAGVIKAAVMKVLVKRK
jgi:serine palmitoyltransferase